MSTTSNRTTLTDRYIWTVTRHLPADTGPDVASELRGTIEDMVESRVEAGADLAEAEQEALTELGDPDALARQYGGRPGYLIGPGIYSEYVRLLKLLAWIVLPTAFIGSFLARTVFGDQEDLPQVLLDSWVLLISVGVHLAFWTTLAFAIIELARPESERDKPLTAWNTDQLPVEGPWRQVRLVDLAFSAFFLLLLIALVVWQFAGVGEDGWGVQVLNPDLWIGWEVLILGFLVVDLALQYAVWRAGRWTPTLAVFNVLANVASVAVLIWLAQRDRLLVPDLPAELNERFGWSADWSVSSGVVVAVLVIFPLWDSIDTVRKARSARRTTAVATAS
jgi:hypothetical protein